MGAMAQPLRLPAASNMEVCGCIRASPCRHVEMKFLHRAELLMHIPPHEHDSQHDAARMCPVQPLQNLHSEWQSGKTFKHSCLKVLHYQQSIQKLCSPIMK